MNIPPSVSGLTLDTGGLIAIDRGSAKLRALLDRATERQLAVVVPAGALGQAWRNGGRQARLSRFMKRLDVTVADLDEPTARAAGELCGLSDTSDIVDASVVLCARTRRHAVVTSDPDDMATLDRQLLLVTV